LAKKKDIFCAALLLQSKRIWKYLYEDVFRFRSLLPETTSECV